MVNSVMVKKKTQFLANFIRVCVFLNHVRLYTHYIYTLVYWLIRLGLWLAIFNVNSPHIQRTICFSGANRIAVLLLSLLLYAAIFRSKHIREPRLPKHVYVFTYNMVRNDLIFLGLAPQYRVRMFCVLYVCCAVNGHNNKNNHNRKKGGQPNGYIWMQGTSYIFFFFGLYVLRGCLCVCEVCVAYRPAQSRSKYLILIDTILCMLLNG